MKYWKIKFLVFSLVCMNSLQAESFETNDEGYPLGLKADGLIDTRAPWRVVDEAFDLPSRFNWRDHYILPDVKNQGSCGSCVAFGVAGVVETLHRIAFGLFKDESHSRSSLIDLSEQTLVSTCSRHGNCGGGWLTHFNYVRDHGLPYELDDPYRASNSRCKNKKGKVKISQWGYVGNRGSRPTVDQIKRALYKYGALAITMNGRISYRGGVFTSCGGATQNHVVILEGWQDDERYKNFGGGYWIIRNSWGARWGESGFIRAVYNRRGTTTPCHGIAQVAAWAELEGIGAIRDHIGND